MGASLLIIGAGVAGLAAAIRLFEFGYTDIKILEATNRIGGRVNTVPFGANVVEIGAQWCHGTKNNSVYDLAGPLGLLENSIVAKGELLLRSNGEVISDEIADRLMTAADSILNEEAMSNYAGTLGEYFTKRFTEVASTQLTDIDSELVHTFLNFYQNFERGSIAQDSLYNTKASRWANSEKEISLSWKSKGYKSILDLMLNRYPGQAGQSIPIENNVLFNKVVTNINWDQGSNCAVTVKCEDGSTYTADQVILTTSLGVLKENIDTMFTPQLPTIKQNAIRGLNFGTVNKIFMEFAEPFWTDMGNLFGLLWDSQDLEALRSSPYAWAEGVINFFKVDNQPNVLAAWIDGKQGRDAELLDDKEIVKGLMFVLQKFFKSKQIPEPLKMTRSKWLSEKHFRGSYSSYSVMTDQLNTGCDDLALPMTNCQGDPVLLFAGEATNRKQQSTVHGAIASGRREADRLIELYKSKANGYPNVIID